MNDGINHILVCDDEEDIREMFAEYLARRGYRISTADGAEALREAVAGDKPDLILLDVNMPGEDGLSVLKSLQVEPRVPVIMLTAAGEVIDRIIGLELGAEDYLGKPVDLRELEARIKVVLRRPLGHSEEAAAATGSRFRFGLAWLDIDAARLTDAEGSEIPITSMEFNLLKLFSENKGRVLNRDQILEGAHDRSWDPFDRSIDIRISRIRRKIEANPQKPATIRTVRGVGYIYDGE
jgi:DNA-binding response OmpR family regulator